MKKPSSVRFWVLSFLSVFTCHTLVADESSAAKAFDALKSSPPQLRHFLLHMPKGADLHNHLAGAIYAESFIKWAAEDGKCVDLTTHQITRAPCDVEENRPPVSHIENDADIVNKIIDGFSTRNYNRRPISGHNQFFATFARFSAAAVGREGDMIAEAAIRAAAQNIGYLELMQSEGMVAAMILAAQLDLSQSVTQLRNNPELEKLVANTLKKLDDIEFKQRQVMGCKDNSDNPGCHVTVRYLAQVIRTLPPNQVYAQTLLAAMLINADKRYVGLNFVAPEDHPVTLRDHSQQMHFIAAATEFLPEEKRLISLHAGELTMGLVAPEHLGKHIREAIEIAGAKRIGHGIDITYDPNFPELMRRMSAQNIAVEINLTSNDVILGVTGPDHPLPTYRKYGVPVTLNTDDEGVSRIDLTHEYQRLVATYGLSYPELKKISRNGLAYSFLSGTSLFTLPVTGKVVKECKRTQPGAQSPDETCANFLNSSDKAEHQWQLEARFKSFEAMY